MITEKYIETLQSTFKPYIETGYISKAEHKEALSRLRAVISNCKLASPVEPRLISRTKASEILCVSVKTVDRMASTGQLRKIILSPGKIISTAKGNTRRAGGNIKIDYADILSIINQGNNPT